MIILVKKEMTGTQISSPIRSSKEKYNEYMKGYMKEYYRTHPSYRRYALSASQKYNHRRIKHNGKTFIIDPIKIGVCNFCRAVRGIDCNHTQWHHIKYDNDISKNIIELCPKCHAKESGLGTKITRKGVEK